MMRDVQLGLEGGCSTPEKPVRPLILDQTLSRLNIVCFAHPIDEGVSIERSTDKTDQEQLDSFCSTCPLNLKAELGDTTPPPFL